MFEVKHLQDEFGFKYASVIGMLIFFMNTFVYLHFAIRKLDKFMIPPGRVHYAAAAAAHPLRHLQCKNNCTGGITYSSDLSKAPITKLLLASIGAAPAFHLSCSVIRLGKIAPRQLEAPVAILYIV